MKETKEAIAKKLEAWLEIDSVTPNESAYLEHLASEVFGALGYEVRRQRVSEKRWNLIATRGKQNPALLYSTHVDTVPPFLPVRREGDRMYGRGACDTKGGLLAMVLAAERLESEEVGFLLVVGEEVDHIGAKTSASLELSPAQIILCEPTVNRVVRAQKGMIKLICAADGVAAHSAYPARGESALHKLIDGLHGILHDEAWPENEGLLGPTTINVGLLEGGVAANVFAPRAEATLLCRTVAPTSEYVPIIERLASEHGIEANILVENDPVFFDTPDDLEGIEYCTVSFNTDASYLCSLGPIWLVGPGDIEVAHTDHEYIDLNELMEGIDLYEKLGRHALSRLEGAS